MAFLKRAAAPRSWPVERKSRKFVVSPLPGPHSGEAMPLAVVIRDVLRYARNMKEANEILLSGAVRVDGAVRKKRGFPVGLMDVLAVGDERYVMLPGKGGIYPGKAAAVKLRKITGKTAVKKGKVQLNFHDGTNMLADGDYSTGDVLAFGISANSPRKIREVVRMEKGATVMVTKGRNSGAVGVLENIKVAKGPKPNTAEISARGKRISLPLGYVFPLPQGFLDKTDAGEADE